MGLFDRILRVLRAYINKSLSDVEEDHEMMLDQSLIDMKEDLVNLRKAVVEANATQQELKEKYEAADAKVKIWQDRARRSRLAGNEQLIRKAFIGEKRHTLEAESFREQFYQQKQETEILEENLSRLEEEIENYGVTTNILKAKSRSAKANEQLYRTVDNFNSGSARAAHARAEEAIKRKYTRAKASIELTGRNLESQYNALENDEYINAKLAALDAELRAEGSDHRSDTNFAP